uniref:NADH-ubiquinone oxidoreductase chain 6 n=1 Tax=Chrysomeloidea sp. 4 KM-2017 TaxID=2219298 RepID=A0A346RGL9_9CUCU|nr:NADH dehydrogenase subunit 6 [Chrysomeloidea sp. 4 KM-2017]
MLMLMTTLFNASLACLMTHPLSLGLTLLIQVILIALITGFMSLNFWSSYIIFMIMIGGMLILFTYMTSIASNEKFNYSPKILMMIVPYTIIMSICMLTDKSLFMSKIKLETTKFDTPLVSQLYLNKFLNYPHMMIYLIIIVFLLITLIAVVTITTKNKGTLRQKF